MNSEVAIKNLDVIFGDDQTQAETLIDKGLSRQQIIEQTGNVVAVSGASLTINKGEICVLMGLSGSGKSSLLRAINGLNPISRGSVEINMHNKMVDLATCGRKTLRHLRMKKVSMVFQKFALMPWLTVLENVAFGLEMQGVSKKQREAKALEQLAMVSLADWANTYPHELSGGMQQRVGLARAFAMDSDILLMDEPFSALDPLIRSQLQDELLALQKQLNKTIIFVSHDLDEALKIGSNIAIMESGKIIQYGDPEEIVTNPKDHYVENFVAHTNPLNVLSGKSLMTGINELPKLAQDLSQQPFKQAYLALTNPSNSDPQLSIQQWHNDDSFDAITNDRVVVTDSDVSMRDALELRYRSGQPVMLQEKDQLIGVLRDKDFYHALLGKHFGHCPA